MKKQGEGERTDVIKVDEEKKEETRNAGTDEGGDNT